MLDLHESECNDALVFDSFKEGYNDFMEILGECTTKANGVASLTSPCMHAIYTLEDQNNKFGICFVLEHFFSNWGIICNKSIGGGGGTSSSSFSSWMVDVI